MVGTGATGCPLLGMWELLRLQAQLACSSPMFPFGRTALCGSIIYQPPSAPAAGMGAYEKRWKMKYTRADWFLNVSTTGEHVSHLESAHPNAQPSVPSWLAVPSVKVETNLKISLAQKHDLLHGNRIRRCVGEHGNSTEWSVSGLSDLAHYCSVSS